MEIKREYDGGQEPASKRASLGTAPAHLDEVEYGPLTFTDIENFKKEALIRQMRHYHRERDFLESKLTSLEAKYVKLQINMRILETAWDHVHTQLSGKYEPFPSLLLLATSSDHPDDTNTHDQLQSQIAHRNDVIRERIGDDLLKGVPVNAELSALSSAMQELACQNEVLKSQKQHAKAEYNELYEKLCRLQVSTERSQSLTVKRINQTVAPAPVKRNSESSHADTSTPVTTSEATNTDESDSKSNSLRCIELEAQLDEHKAVLQKQKQIIDQQDTKISALSQRVQSVSLQLLNPSAEHLAQCEVFVSLKSKYESLKDAHEACLNRLNSLEDEKIKLVSEKCNFEQTLKLEYEKRREDLEQRITRADQDLIRIRNARDEVLGQLTIKKAQETEKSKSVDLLKEALRLGEERIQQLVQERSEERNAQRSEVASINDLDSKSPQELKQLVVRLTRQNDALSAELPNVEEAFAKAHSKAIAKIDDLAAREAKMNKLSVEKAKADEKYFSAMRSKDALVTEHNKVKYQLSKSIDVIQHLKDSEKTIAQKLSRSEKSCEEMERSKFSLERKVAGLKSLISDKDSRINSGKALVERIENQLKAADERLQTELEEKRELQLEVEKVKSQLRSRDLFRPSAQSNGDDHEQHLNSLRSIAMCSVCSKNWKDTAIKVCGHVFCLSCAKDRLNSRLRKCPTCNKQYSHSDLLPVHL